jgi:hypothetical protein
MNIPIQPEPSKIPDLPTGVPAQQDASLLQDTCKSVLASQQERLEKATAAKGSSRQIQNILNKNEKELQSTIEQNPQTQSLPPNAKQSFISSQIAQQRQTFLDPLQSTSMKSFQRMAQIKTEALASAAGIETTSGTQPITEGVIKQNGVSYVLIPDPQYPDDPTKAMAFPISQTAAQGAEGGPDYSSSEAIWYTMQNAYNAGDKTLFQQTANAYLYLVDQKNATIAATNQQNYANQWAATPGLMGWTFDLGSNPPGSNILSNIEGKGGFPYASDFTNPSNAGDAGLSTATDADEGIINMMIQAQSRWGDMSLHCFGTFPPAAALQPSDPALPAPATDTDLTTLLNQAVNSFMAYDVSNKDTPPTNGTRNGFTYDGTTYYPILTNDNWGHNTLNPSYANFGELANIYNYMTSQGTFGSSPQLLKQAVQNTVQYLQALQNDYNGGLPDNPTWSEVGGKPTSVGWDSIRFLSTSGMYLYNSIHGGSPDPFGILSQVQSMTQKMASYVWSIGVNPGASNMTLNNGSTLSGPALLGPLLVAMKALNYDGNLPSNIPQSAIQQVSDSLDASVAYNPSNTDPSVWQQNYYAVELYLINRYCANQIPDPQPS